jgi:hypothetical protein
MHKEKFHRLYASSNMAHNLASDQLGVSLLRKTSSNQAHNLLSDRLRASLLYKKVQFPPM